MNQEKKLTREERAQLWKLLGESYEPLQRGQVTQQEFMLRSLGLANNFLMFRIAHRKLFLDLEIIFSSKNTSADECNTKIVEILLENRNDIEGALGVRAQMTTKRIRFAKEVAPIGRPIEVDNVKVITERLVPEIERLENLWRSTCESLGLTLPLSPFLSLQERFKLLQGGKQEFICYDVVSAVSVVAPETRSPDVLAPETEMPLDEFDDLELQGASI